MNDERVIQRKKCSVGQTNGRCAFHFPETQHPYTHVRTKQTVRGEEGGQAFTFVLPSLKKT